MAGPGESVMALTSTKGADMDVLIFVGTWVSAVASEIPTDTDDMVVGAEEILVCVL